MMAKVVKMKSILNLALKSYSFEENFIVPPF